MAPDELIDETRDGRNYLCWKLFWDWLFSWAEAYSEILRDNWPFI